jgi:perosamine synthetase
MFEPTVTSAAIERVTACLRSGWISEGRAVKSFEDDFARRFGLPNALAVNSGTAGLHLAVLGAGVGPGDEVITTAQTFVATAMVVMQAGGTPVFADVESGGPNIDPADVEKRITSRTKAILVVHYGGYPCAMDELRALARSHGIALIEDAAHALGATYHGEPVGTMGDFGVFSFQAIKQLTTGDGGMLVCGSEEQYRVALRRRWFGIDRERRTQSELGEPEWDITDVGYKYHMNDIAASIGLGHLESFADAQERRVAIAGLYRDRLAAVSGAEMLASSPGRESADWLFTLRVQRRSEFVRAVCSRGVEAGVWHRRIDSHTLFGGVRADLPNLAEFDAVQVSVPLRHTLTDDQVERVIEAVEAGW